MGFRKEIKNQLNNMSEKIDSLNKHTFLKIQKYEEISKYLSKIKLSVKSTNFIINKNGSISVKIDYDLPSLIINFDDKSEIVVNDTFVAINMLNLVGIKDMEKLNKMINEAKERNSSSFGLKGGGK